MPDVVMPSPVVPAAATPVTPVTTAIATQSVVWAPVEGQFRSIVPLATIGQAAHIMADRGRMLLGSVSLLTKAEKNNLVGHVNDLDTFATNFSNAAPDTLPSIATVNAYNQHALSVAQGETLRRQRILGALAASSVAIGGFYLWRTRKKG